MSYPIERISEIIGARRIGNVSATIDWLLTDSRSLSFPEETLFLPCPPSGTTASDIFPTFMHAVYVIL